MAANMNEEVGMGTSVDGILSGQQCQSGEALAEWRSSEQVENGTPSTSPPYWDTDDDDDEGPKPSELYGKYTWKIEKFSQISKRELRSNPFEVGNYKWYILIYPQGCDVCNHLSLFLCVANHDKLLPGWSHFAQFTIAVVNNDPKKSKYSDTLHRFWKKEHDWGWKKFMELSKVSDGFLDSNDTLVIKAQVQVIREKADRPFRCLDCQYRRELVRVYLTNVEQICRRFVEERRSKLGRLIEDKDTWSSFREFWVRMDRNTRRCMSREKTDVILKVVVKHFFIEKEVTSTLVMDSLYSGLKALECQSNSKKGKEKLLDSEETPAPIVCVEKDMFALVDDVLHLIERAAMEPLPPKDEKGPQNPQNRTKEGCLGEDFNKDSIERDERRLTELGRRTVEIFILAHIFNHKIEVSYHEAVALKRQEELIREEELAAWLAESDQKAKRGTIEKEKKVKKKQAKQKKNNKKIKEKAKEEKSIVAVLDKQEEDSVNNDRKDVIVVDAQIAEEKSDIPEDASDVSDSVDCGGDLHPDLEERVASPVHWDTDTSEAQPPIEVSSTGAGAMPLAPYERRNSSAMDDSSSTCSTDSVPSVVSSFQNKGNSNYRHDRSLNRGKSQQLASCNGRWTAESEATANDGDSVDYAECSKDDDFDAESFTSHDKSNLSDRQSKNPKDEGSVSQVKPNVKGLADGVPSKEKILPNASRNPPITFLSKPETKSSASGDSFHTKKVLSSNCYRSDKVQPPATSAQESVSKVAERPVVQAAGISRPGTAPLVAPRPVTPVVSMMQNAPILSRSVSATGRLGPDPSPATHSYAPQSYRNAIIGSNSSGFSPSSCVNQGSASGHQPSSMFLPPLSDRIDLSSVRSGYPYGMLNRDGLQWVDDITPMVSDSVSVMNGYQSFQLYKPFNNRIRENRPLQTPASSSGRHSQGVAIDEFPHLDIINDLLDDEHVIAKTTAGGRYSQSFMNGPQFLNRQYSLPSESAFPSEMGSSSSSSSSCRFERTRSNQDGGFQRGFSQYESVREYAPPSASPLNYSNGHMDGVVPNRWHMGGSDLLAGMMNPEGDAPPPSYFGADYSTLPCGVNGYPFFRPSNGH